MTCDELNSLEAQAKGLKNPYPKGALDSDNYTSQCANRQSAKAVLKDKIFKLHQRARELETLCAMLPEYPNLDQDNALFQIFTSL